MHLNLIAFSTLVYKNFTFVHKNVTCFVNTCSVDIVLTKGQFCLPLF